MNIDLVMGFIVIIVVSYLFGSIPSAYLICRANGVNIFTVGSGNMGATNVIRALTGKYTARWGERRAKVFGFLWGVLVWFCDSLKGMIPIWIAAAIVPDHAALARVTAAVVAIIGHTLSVWAWVITGRLRGGKGAATAFGAMLVIVPIQIVAVMLIIGTGIIIVTRYVSLAVLVMFGLSTVWMIILFTQAVIPIEYLVFALTIAVILFVRFRENIQRLLAGTERRLGEGA
jgi:glycerol-3-phosphate acyltransferase PlsY